MECVTIKAGHQCAFMTKNGCSFNGGQCYPVVEQCEGCERVLNLPQGKYCAAVPNPQVKWRIGSCNLATHVKRATTKEQELKINPLKASKRKARG